MKKILFTLLSASILFTSCKDKKDKEAGTNETTVNPTTEPKPSDPAADSVAIKTTIMDFYNWYNKNYQKLIAFDLYDGIKKKDMPPYKILWDGVDKLQRYIRDSVPQLGEAFLMDQKKMLQKADSAFKVDIKDEIPYGFDYDWYTNSQEDPQYTIDEINKSRWEITVNGDNAVARIMSGGEKNELAFLMIDMKKEAGQWKIAKIGAEEY